MNKFGTVDHSLPIFSFVFFLWAQQSPTFSPKLFIQSDFHKQEIKGDTADGKLLRADTVQIDRLDYAFNSRFSKERICLQRTCIVKAPVSEMLLTL